MADNEKKLVDERIKALEAQLQSAEAAQAKRGDDLERELTELRGKHDFQRKRADKAEGQLRRATPAQDGDRVVLGGQIHRVINCFRADNTFVEVKRGHCDEGITLVAIDKVF